MLPVSAENHMCSHPCTGNVTSEKIPEKTGKKFKKLTFSNKVQACRVTRTKVATMCSSLCTGDATCSKNHVACVSKKIAPVVTHVVN